MKRSRLVLTTLSLLLCLSLISPALADTLKLPENLKVIEEEAFYGDESLDEVQLPDSVETVGDRAFAESGMTKINLPDNLDNIADNAIGQGVTVEAEEGTPAYNWAVAQGLIEDNSGGQDYSLDDFSFSDNGDETCTLLSYRRGSTDIVIPSHDSEGRPVTEIGRYAFYNRSDLTGNLVLPDGLTSIGDGAFSGCSGLTGSVIIPDTVTSIGESAFRNCSGLNGTLKLSENLSEISFALFQNCSSITGILRIPASVTRISYYAFDGCSGISEVYLPAGITEIESKSFDNTNCLFHFISGTYAEDWCRHFGYYDDPKAPELLDYSFTAKELHYTDSEPETVNVALDISYKVKWNYYADCYFAYYWSNSPIELNQLNHHVGMIANGPSTKQSLLVEETVQHNVSYNPENKYYLFFRLSNKYGKTDIGPIEVSAEQLSTTRYITLKGKAVTPDGNPIAGACVYNGYGYSTYTDRNGEWIIDHYNRSISGTAIFYAYHPDYIISEYGNGILSKIHYGPSVEIYPDFTGKPYTLSGSFTDKQVFINQGQQYQIQGQIHTSDYLRKAYISIDNGSEKKQINNILFAREVNLDEHNELMLDTSIVPLNTAGDHKISLWAGCSDNDRYLKKLDEMTVTVVNDSQIAGAIVTDSGDPVGNVFVVAQNTEDESDYCYTVSDGQGKWSLTVKPDTTYNIIYRHGTYEILQATVTTTGFTSLKAIATLPGETDSAASFTMKKDESVLGGDVSVMVGNTVRFTVNVPGAVRIQLVVDDVEYEEYTVTDGVAVFSRSFSKAGTRSVRFHIMKEGEYTYSSFTPHQILIVDKVDTLTKPQIHSVEEYDLSSDKPLKIYWDTVSHAVSYRIYLYHDGMRVYPANKDSKETETANLWFEVPRKVLSAGTGWTVEVVAAGEEGWSSATGTSEPFSIVDTKEQVVLSASKTNACIGERIYFDVTSCFTEFDSCYVDCTPNHCEMNENAILFTKSGTYTASATLTKDGVQYTSNTVTIYVAAPAKAELYGPVNDVAAVESTVTLKADFDFVPYTVILELEGVIIDVVNNIPDGKFEKSFAFTDVLPNSPRPVNYQVIATDSGGTDYPTNEYTVYAVEEVKDGSVGKLYYATCDTPLLAKPGFEEIGTVNNQGPVTLEKSKYDGYREVNYMGQKGFVLFDDLLEAPAGNTPVLTRQTDPIVFLNDGTATVNYTIKTFAGAKNAFIHISYIPEQHLDKDYPAFYARTVVELDPCERTEEGSIFFTYPARLNSPGVYYAYVICVNNNNDLSVVSNCDRFTVAVSEEKQLYLKHFESMEIYDCPVDGTAVETVRWDRKLNIVGKAGNFYVVEKNDKHGFIHRGDTAPEINRPEKRAYIISAKSLTTIIYPYDNPQLDDYESFGWLLQSTGESVMFGAPWFGAIEQYDEKMTDLFSAADYTCVSRPSVTCADLDTILESIAETSDFNDYTAITILTHGSGAGYSINDIKHCDYDYKNRLLPALKKIRGNVTLISCTCFAGAFLDTFEENDPTWPDMDKFVFIGASKRHQEAPIDGFCYVFVDELSSRISAHTKELTFAKFKTYFPEGTLIEGAVATHTSNTIYWSASDDNYVIK